MSELETGCSIDAIQPLLAVFDAALGPLQPYFDLLFNIDDLGEVEIAELTATLALGPAAVPVLQGLAFAQAINAAIDLPPMPDGGFGLDVGLGLTAGNWDLSVQGQALVELVIAMVTVPINLIIAVFEGETLDFPGVIIGMLPDVAGSVTLAECIADRIPIFG